MLATVPSATLVGIQGHPISVEVHVSAGIPCFNIVGLPDTSCREARDRVRAAIISSGLRWPQRRITVNLAPSGLRKGGSGLDLPLAVALLAADGQLDPKLLDGLAFLGELGLDGSVRAISGVLPLVGALSKHTVVVPDRNLTESRAIAGGCARGVLTLRQLVAVLEGTESWSDPPAISPGAPPVVMDDIADVRGQALGRRAVEVAAAGGHHLLLVGPPGAGKTMLASRLRCLLPPLSQEESVEVSMIHSAAGLPLPSNGLVQVAPLRSPHHSCSVVSLVGGGTTRMRPGEISCAHRGVLFLDELGEFRAEVLDNLRQPLEEGCIRVSRARASATFPARFLLVAAMNACPCGGEGAPGGCKCTETSLHRYAARVSAPLLDRFDIRVLVSRPDPGELLLRGARKTLMPDDPEACEVAEEAEVPQTSEQLRDKVAFVRCRAAGRGFYSNSEIPSALLDQLAPLAPDAIRVLEVRLRQGQLSARGLHRVRRVALTIADLEGSEGPLTAEHVLVALAMRVEPFSGAIR